MYPFMKVFNRMPSHADSLRLALSSGPRSPAQLIEKMGISQPTLSRAMAQLGGQVLRLGAARSIQYALRDALRGLPDMPVYRVDTQGALVQLGTLIPVRAEGFVMCQQNGAVLHSEGLPWWLFDMRPQGYLGRAYAAAVAAELGAPPRLGDWTDTHVLQALLRHGQDAVGNLLLGEAARESFLSAPLPEAISARDKAREYTRRAGQAARGERPGSSAGGEQPKFTCYTTTPNGPSHVIVKFSEPEPSPVSERWRDLLLCEHLALETLRQAGVAAAVTHLVDTADQRFLEVERFDRVGPLGRRGLLSLAALDAQFVGDGKGSWPHVARALADLGHIHRQAVELADVLWAYGSLIGNADMHGGNLSFVTEQGRPYDTAPAYDMTPMSFAPRSGGGLPDDIFDTGLAAAIRHDTWRQAESLARSFLARLKADARPSPRFAPCIAALEKHLNTQANKIARLG
jgi:hypothetical protein